MVEDGSRQLDKTDINRRDDESGTTSDTTRNIYAKVERAIKLMQRSKFLKALKILRKLDASEDSDKMNVAFLIAECVLFLKNADVDAAEVVEDEDEVIQNVKKAVPHSIQDLKKLSRQMQAQGQFLRALILLSIAHDIDFHEKSNDIPPTSPDTIAQWMGFVVLDVDILSKEILRSNVPSRDIAIEFALNFTQVVLYNLRHVADVSDNIRAVTEAHALNTLSYITGRWGDFQKAVRFAEEGLNCLRRQFGESAPTFRCHGWLLGNTGFAYQGCGQSEDAERFYDEAIASAQIATDYTHIDKKKSFIDFCMEIRSAKFVRKIDVNN